MSVVQIGPYEKRKEGEEELECVHCYARLRHVEDGQGSRGDNGVFENCPNCSGQVFVRD